MQICLRIFGFIAITERINHLRITAFIGMGDAALTRQKGKYKDTGIPLKVNRKIIIDV